MPTTTRKRNAVIGVGIRVSHLQKYDGGSKMKERVGFMMGKRLSFCMEIVVITLLPT